MKRRKRIFLLGSNTDRTGKIAEGLLTGLKLPNHGELEVVLVQTQKDFRELLTGNWQTGAPPLAVLIDSYLVTNRGCRTHPDKEIQILKDGLNFDGPIVAIASHPHQNDDLCLSGATHRIGWPMPAEDDEEPDLGASATNQLRVILFPPKDKEYDRTLVNLKPCSGEDW